jgi:hypothetical protein
MNTQENPTITPPPALTGTGRYGKTYTGKHIRPATKPITRIIGLGWPTTDRKAK